MAAIRTPSDHVSKARLIERFAVFAWSQVTISRPFQALVLSLVAFSVFAIDAALRFPGALDIETMKFVQRLDFEQLGPWLEIFEALTDSSGAVIAWGATLVMFTALRWWLPVLGVLAIPAGGVVNETISRVLIQRTRPHLEELRHVSQNFEDRSFPSGHVVGAVLLYGFIWYVAGDRIRFAPLRWAIRSACAVIIAVSGFDRVWSGAHWPSDVGGAYALGLALVLLLVFACEWIEREAEGLHRNEGVLALFIPAPHSGAGAVASSTNGVRGRVQALMIALRPMVLALAPPSGSHHDASAPGASRGH